MYGILNYINCILNIHDHDHDKFQNTIICKKKVYLLEILFTQETNVLAYNFIWLISKHFMYHFNYYKSNG